MRPPLRALGGRLPEQLSLVLTADATTELAGGPALLGQVEVLRRTRRPRSSDSFRATTPPSIPDVAP